MECWTPIAPYRIELDLARHDRLIAYPDVHSARRHVNELMSPLGGYGPNGTRRVTLSCGTAIRVKCDRIMLD